MHGLHWCTGLDERSSCSDAQSKTNCKQGSQSDIESLTSRTRFSQLRLQAERKLISQNRSGVHIPVSLGWTPDPFCACFLCDTAHHLRCFDSHTSVRERSRPVHADTDTRLSSVKFTHKNRTVE